jgi:acyl dehydratase
MCSKIVGSKLFLNQMKNLFSNEVIMFKNLSSVQIGAKAELSRTFSAEDVNSFAKLSGDTNPIHLDENYSSKTKFGRCIVHGALINGYTN